MERNGNYECWTCFIEGVPCNVFWGRLIQDEGNDWRVPIMWFDVGGLKNIGRILNNSFYINPQGPQNRGSSGGAY